MRCEPPPVDRARPLVDFRALDALFRDAVLRPRVEFFLVRDAPLELDLLAALRERPLLELFPALFRAPLVLLRAAELRDLFPDDDLFLVEVVGINIYSSVPKYFLHFASQPKRARPCKFFRGRPDLNT